MANPDRLTGLDSSFLHLEHDAAHMHVAGCMVFDGEPPGYDELVDQIVSRLHLVPRYRQRLAFVPFGQGRPVWVDDPHFNPAFHVRHTGLPTPGDEAQLKRLCGRIFSQALDRSRPLWELWLVEGLSDGPLRAALQDPPRARRRRLGGGHRHRAVRRLARSQCPSPRRITTGSHGPCRPAPSCWPTPCSSGRPSPPRSPAGVRATLRGPRQMAGRMARALGGVSAVARLATESAPQSPLNVRIGPHRRFTWVRGDLAQFKAVKNALGGTVNDVVLAAVAGALGSYLRGHGEATDDTVLRAMVPVSVRADIERGALGNRVAAMWTPLPIGVRDPVQRLLTISRAMEGIKDSGQAVGAQVLTELTGFAPPTIMAQAARLQARQRMFNLVVTNVPGPQFPLYMLGRQLEAMFPMVPLAANQALGIAIMSYNGQLNFGLNADYDALPDLEALADRLRDAIAELVDAAGEAPRRRDVPRQTLGDRRRVIRIRRATSGGERA